MPATPSACHARSHRRTVRSGTPISAASCEGVSPSLSSACGRKSPDEITTVAYWLTQGGKRKNMQELNALHRTPPGLGCEREGIGADVVHCLEGGSTVTVCDLSVPTARFVRRRDRGGDPLFECDHH